MVDLHEGVALFMTSWKKSSRRLHSSAIGAAIPALETRGSFLKGICHPSAHAQQFDFLSDGTFFKVDICERNPFPSTL